MRWEEITQGVRNACNDCPGPELDECQHCPLNALALDALRIAVLSRSERNRAMIQREIDIRYRQGKPNSEGQPYPGDTSKAASPAPPVGGHEDNKSR